ncbi:MAG: hypothetical protein AB1938_21530 [Myxococcota bacterium]
MGKVLFGKDEKIECIQPIDLKGADGEDLCLAYKTSKYFVFAGVYMKDDGYVLGVPKVKGTYYPLPEATELQGFQARGLVPSPLPGYSIPIPEYLFGYSLWLVIALVAGFGWLKSARTKRRKARDAAIPVSLGPPTIATDGDRFISDTVRPLLRPGEQVQHQAYGVRDRPDDAITAARNVGLFAVLTNQRVLFVQTKVGAFKPVLENHGVTEVERSSIVNAVEDDYLIVLTLNDGTARTIFVGPQQKHFSNQQAFIRDIPRLLGKAQVTEAQPQVIG